MKRLVTCFAAILLCFSVYSAADTLVSQKEFDTAMQMVNKKNTQQDSAIKAIAATGNKEMVGKNEAGSSLFKAWEYATNNPLPLYCDLNVKGPVNCKDCKKPTTYIGFIAGLAWLLLAAIIIGFFYLFFRSPICRDESYIKSKEGDFVWKPLKQRPFSYARVQLFWWTLIILCCYVVFFARYGTLLPLNPTSILLLGGGLATLLLGKTIDQSQIDNTKKGAGADAKPEPIRHQDIEDSKGFLIDILSDDTGVSIHRLQAVIFNLVFGLAYIGFFVSSISNCQYPLKEFEAWQLTLLGISTAGYLGFKTMENSKSTEPARSAKANQLAAERNGAE